MRRELIAIVGKIERTIIVEPGDNGSWRVTLDGKAHEVDAALVRPGTWSLLIDGCSYVVDLDERKRGTTAMSSTSETPIRVEDARRRRLAQAVSAGAAHATGGLVEAPIAGKVVKIVVAVGDVVKPGQVVAVLEAMKMENEINTEVAGKVATVHVAAGQSVEAQDTLVTLS